MTRKESVIEKCEQRLKELDVYHHPIHGLNGNQTAILDSLYKLGRTLSLDELGEIENILFYLRKHIEETSGG